MGVAVRPCARRLTLNARTIQLAIEMDNSAYALAFMHQLEGLVDVFKPHGMGDKGVQRDFAGFSLLDIRG
ncbi:hypothetical protein D3C86_2131020 [compost metagenome]